MSKCKKVIIILFSVLLLITLSGCYYYKTEGTKKYYVKDFLVHDTGVEVWAISENGEENGFFVDMENVHPSVADSIVTIHNHNAAYDAFNFDNMIIGDLKNICLYLHYEEFDEYLNEKYN